MYDIIKPFHIGDLTESEYAMNKIIAYGKYKAGEEYNTSTGICGSLTAGYGRLDEYGYWEYPLNIDESTFKILPRT